METEETSFIFSSRSNTRQRFDKQIGRDYLFDMMREHGLHIRNRKRKVVTTNSRHWMHKCNNLTKGVLVNAPEQVWVSDITYIQLRKQWGYLSLITDAYSKKIMGWAFRKNLSAQGCIDALEMAIAERKYPGTKLTHHSDRGSQYCSKGYVDLLIDGNIAVFNNLYSYIRVRRSSNSRIIITGVSQVSYRCMTGVHTCEARV